VKWGMTPEQVRTLMGPKSEIMRDPKTGRSLVTVVLNIDGMELNGFASTDGRTGRVNGVHLTYRDPAALKQPSFDSLRRALIKQYGAPPSELSLSGGRRICAWRFTSSNILLTSVSLSYMQNAAGVSLPIPLEN
jgi:hypothetical protein